MQFKTIFNVQEYGARGIARAGETLELKNLHFKWLHYPAGLKATIYAPTPGAEYDSAGIQRAIDAAHAAGGGTVLVPSGDYLIAPLQLRSRVCLHLEPGARLWGSRYLRDYTNSDLSVPRFSIDLAFGRANEGLGHNRRRLISAEDAEDVAITGMGEINAQSPQWVIPWMNEGPTAINTLQRPTDTVLFYRCRRIRVEGVSILNTPAWTLVFDCCRDVQVRGVKTRSFDVIHSDGIDLVNTSDATISDCNIWATDDAICLKNTIADHTMGNIAVSNCIIRTLCNGVKIGTDSLGNFQDITVNNIVISNPDDDIKGAEGGINLCAVDGGFVRNVNLSNLVMRKVDCPFYLLSSCRIAQQQSVREPRCGLMERIAISNLQAEGTRYTPWIIGRADQPIRDVQLSDINIRKTRDFYTQMPPAPVPDRPEQYPNPFMFGQFHGRDELPAFGLYLRHARQVRVRGLHVECIEADCRPLVAQEQCSAMTLRDCKSNLVEAEEESTTVQAT